MSEPFKGTINIDIRDSVPDWSPFEPPRAPDGAPNVVYIVLDELATYAAVRVVLGNNDGPDVANWGATPTLEFDLDGLPVAMLHNSGPAAGRPARLLRQFPNAALVVFGHSHIPWDTMYRGQRSFNPGSPTDRRRQPHATMGLMRVARGRLLSAELIMVT